MMPQIFVFTAGDHDARAHLADSIESPVSDEVVFATFPQELPAAKISQALIRISASGSWMVAECI